MRLRGDWRWDQEAEGGGGIQAVINILESSFSLVEKPVDNALAEFSLVFVVVHFEDLFKGLGVDAVAEVG